MTLSETYFANAQKSIPGGVNSPVRAFKSVGGTPRFLESAEGAYLYDVDGNRMIDYVGSWGPMILGHAHPEVIAAVKEAANRGLSFGAPTQHETTLAELVKSHLPTIELIRMVNSGTEATMSAIRLARGVTGRDKVVKFEGCYHGHADSLLVKAGSGALTFGVPNSPGVPAPLAELTLTLPYNDSAAVESLFAEMGEEVACIIVEPIAGNMNCIPPVAGFLEQLRAVCDRYGALLIFDEVMTGFRVAAGGAQNLYQVTPDLTALGKILGGGMPVGAFGGKREIMEQLAPTGPIYQAGTLSGNPIGMAAGMTTLRLLQQPGFYEKLGQKCQQLCDGIRSAAEAEGIPFITHQVGGMFGWFFTDAPQVTCYDDVTKCDLDRFNQFFQFMLSHDIYLAPSAYEAGFISIQHSDADIDQTINTARQFFKTLN